MTTADGPDDASAALFAGWRAIGAARGYDYHELIVAPRLAGHLFSEGVDVVAQHVMDALSSANPFLAGSLSGRYTSARTIVSTSFIAIPLARSMPNIVLVNARSGALRDAGIAVGSRELLTLEGDFDRAFSLYCPIGGAALALEMFSPKLMQLLLQGASNSDVEIVNNWMFIYGDSHSYGSNEMLDAIEVVSKRVGGAIVPPSFESIESRVPGVADRARSTFSGRTLAVIALAVVAVGGLLTWWGSQGV